MIVVLLNQVSLCLAYVIILEQKLFILSEHISHCFCFEGGLDFFSWFINFCLCCYCQCFLNSIYQHIPFCWQVDGVSYLETCDKIDRSCKTQITEKSASSKFSRGMNKLPDSGLAKNLQPFDASAEVVTEKNGRFVRPCSSSGGSLTQKDDLCASVKLQH